MRALGIGDRLEIGFTAELPGTLIEVLIDPDASSDDIASAFGDALNPFTGWEAKLAGSVSLLGFELGKVSGVVFSPQDTDNDGQAIGGTIFANNVFNFGFPNDRELTAENTDLPVGFEDAIPVYFDEAYDNMTSFGGLLLTGELNIPEFLRDPIPAFEALVQLTDEAGGNLAEPFGQLTDSNLDLSDLSNAQEVGTVLAGYFENVIAVLTDKTPLGTLQLYIPSPATLVDGFLDYSIPSLIGVGDGGGETILADRVPGVDDEGNAAFEPATTFSGGSVPELRFVDLNANAFYDPRFDVLIDVANNIWSDAIPAGSQLGDLAFGAGDAAVDASLINGLPQFVLNDVADDEGNGFFDAASDSVFERGTSVGFVDTNRNGELDWSADPQTGAVTFHEPLVRFTDGGDLGTLTTLPNLAVFLDEAALVPAGSADGFTPPGSTSAGDQIIGLQEGFVDANANGRFDLGIDLLYDLNGNGLPDGELFIDADVDGRFTKPEPLDDINGNGVRDVGDNLTEPFTDLNGNDAFDTGDPFLELGNGLYDPPAEPVFTFDSVSQQAEDLLNAAYIDGFADLQLFGIDLGNGRLRADSSGLFVDISSGPIGADLSFGLGFNEFNAGELIETLTDGPLAVGANGGIVQTLLPDDLRAQADQFVDGLVDLAGDFSFPFPTASLDVDFSLDNVREWLNENFGSDVADIIQFVDATAGFELYSPLFNEQPPSHPTADPDDPRFVDPPLRQTDDIQRFGGGRISATLNIPNFVEGAVGIFEAQFPNTPEDLLAPDFALLAKADKLAIPGVSDDILRAENLSISVVKDTQPGAAIASASISGSVGVLEGFGGGLSASLDGNLTLDASAGVFGHLVVDIEAGELHFDSNRQLKLGADADVRLLVNGTGSNRTISFLNADGLRQSVEMDPASGLLWVDGELLLGTTRVAGTFQISASSSGVTVAGTGEFSDSTMSLLLGEQVEAGIEVTFAAGLEGATRRVGTRTVPDGMFGVFLFSSSAELAIAQASTAFSVGFNTSDSAQTLSTDLGSVGEDLGLSPVEIPGELQSLRTVDARSGRLFVSGDIGLSQLPFDVGLSGQLAGQFTLGARDAELDLYAEATLDLGFLGSVAGRGYLEFGGGASTPGVAGFFEIQADRFGIRDIAEVSGSVGLSFNTGRDVDVPAFIRNTSTLGRISIPTDTFVEVGFDNARMDLFNIVAIGGTGSVKLSASDGIEVEGGMGIQLVLPDVLTSPFGGIVPRNVDLVGTVPNVPGTGRLEIERDETFELPIDVTFDAVPDLLIFGSVRSGFQLAGFLDLGFQRSQALGGLVTASGNFDLEFNTSSSQRTVGPRRVRANTFMLDVGGELVIDATPANGGADANLSINGRFTVDSIGNQMDISGRGEVLTTVLGAEFIGVNAAFDAGINFAGTPRLTRLSLTGQLPNPEHIAWTLAFESCRVLGFSVSDCIDGIEALVPPTGIGAEPPREIRETIPNPEHAAWTALLEGCRATGLSTSQCISGVNLPGIGAEPPRTVRVTVPNPAHIAWQEALNICRGLGFSQSDCINGATVLVPLTGIGAEPPTTLSGPFGIPIPNPAHPIWLLDLEICQLAGFSRSQCINGVFETLDGTGIGAEPARNITENIPNPEHAAWSVLLEGCRATGFSRSQCINGVQAPGIGREPPRQVTITIPNPEHVAWTLLLETCQGVGFSRAQCINGVFETIPGTGLGPEPPATIDGTLGIPFSARALATDTDIIAGETAFASLDAELLLLESVFGLIDDEDEEETEGASDAIDQALIILSDEEMGATL